MSPDDLAPKDQKPNVFLCTTPFPNSLLDDVMPSLKDTEWRLLCVIVRQTLGFWDKKTKNRKVCDWLTQAQLLRKTGRDRAAISRALDALVQGRYIEVRSETGRLLQSPGERRQCKGRLFFALHPRLLRGLLADVPTQEAVPLFRDKSEHQTPGPSTLSRRGGAKSEYHLAPKANTTKEIETKINTENFDNQRDDERDEAERHETKADRPAGAQAALPMYSDPAVTRFVQVYKEQYQAHHNTGIPCVLPDDIRQLSEVLACHPEGELTKLLEKFFVSNISYVKRHHYSLGAFLSALNVLKVVAARR